MKKDKKKIVYIVSDANKSGGPKHVLYLVQGLHRDYNITVISPNGWLVNELQKLGITVHISGLSIFSFFSLRKILKKEAEKDTIFHFPTPDNIKRDILLALKR